MSNLTVDSTTLERLVVTVTTPEDPTGIAPSFSITADTVTTPGAWVTGTWEGAWGATSGRVEALTPQVGETGGLAIAEGSRYQVWVKWTAGADVPVRKCGVITAR